MQGYATELERLIAEEDQLIEMPVIACKGDQVLGRQLAQKVMARSEKEMRRTREIVELMIPDVQRVLLPGILKARQLG